MIDTNQPISADDLFTDEQMRAFLTNGFVVIKPDLPRSLHDTIYQKLDQAVEMDGNPGNNLLPRVPEIQEVYDHPTVRGALTSVIGPNYMMHPHRHHTPIDPEVAVGVGTKIAIGDMVKSATIAVGGRWACISRKIHR